MTPNSSNVEFLDVMDAQVTDPSVGDGTALAASAQTTDTRSNLHSFLGNLLQKHDVASSEVRIVDDNAVVSLETRMSFCSDNNATNNKGISRWSSTPEIVKLGMRRTSSSPTVSRSRAGRSNRLSASTSSSSRNSRRVGSNSTRAFDDSLSSGGNGSSNATWDTLPAAPLSSSVLEPSATKSVHQSPMHTSMGSTVPMMIKRQLAPGKVVREAPVRPSSLSPPRPKSPYPPTMTSASTSAPRLPNRCRSPGMGLSMPVRTVDDFVVGVKNSAVPVLPMKPNAAATANDGTGNKTLFASIMSSPSLGLMDLSSISSVPSDADDGSSILSNVSIRTNTSSNDEIVRNSFSKGIQGSKTHHYLSKTSSSSSKESERRLRSALGSMAPRISSKDEANKKSKQGLNSLHDSTRRTSTASSSSSSARLDDVKKTLQLSHQYTKLEGSYNHTHNSSLPPSLRDFDLSAVSHKSSSTGRTLRGGV